MDLVDWSYDRFIEIRDTFEEFLPLLGMKDVKFIPMSALNGDNVVDPSRNTPWYEGPTLLGHLENLHIASDWNLNAFRLPVQWVNRPNNPTNKELHDFRGLSGRFLAASSRSVKRSWCCQAGLRSTVKGIWTYDGALQEAFCPQSVTVQLGDDIDVSRGDTIVGPESLPGVSVDKLDVEIVVILRDKQDLQFKREAEAKVVKSKKGELVIEQFYPMNLLQKLSVQKETVEDWRELVESVMVDWNYDGGVFEPKLVDVPDKDELVKGTYPIPKDAGTIMVKITDLLSESLEIELR